MHLCMGTQNAYTSNVGILPCQVFHCGWLLQSLCLQLNHFKSLFVLLQIGSKYLAVNFEINIVLLNIVLEANCSVHELLTTGTLANSKFWVFPQTKHFCFDMCSVLDSFSQEDIEDKYIKKVKGVSKEAPKFFHCQFLMFRCLIHTGCMGYRNSAETVRFRKTST